MSSCMTRPSLMKDAARRDAGGVARSARLVAFIIFAPALLARMLDTPRRPACFDDLHPDRNSVAPPVAVFAERLAARLAHRAAARRRCPSCFPSGRYSRFARHRKSPRRSCDSRRNYLQAHVRQPHANGSLRDRIVLACPRRDRRELLDLPFDAGEILPHRRCAGCHRLPRR